MGDFARSSLAYLSLESMFVAVIAVTFIEVTMVMSERAAVRLAVDLQDQRAFCFLFVEMFEQVFVVGCEAG